MRNIRELPGLGPQSEAKLKEVGIATPDDLFEMGALQAFIKLQRHNSAKTSLNFLYALVGAIENRPWQQVAQQEKYRLLMELEGYAELEKRMKE